MALSRQLSYHKEDAIGFSISTWGNSNSLARASTMFQSMRLRRFFGASPSTAHLARVKRGGGAGGGAWANSKRPVRKHLTGAGAWLTAEAGCHGEDPAVLPHRLGRHPQGDRSLVCDILNGDHRHGLD